MTENKLNNKTYAVILAAGQGKRMNSDLPKVLHKVLGRPMIEYVLESAVNAGIKNIILVVGHKKELVEECVKNWILKNKNIDIQFSVQEEQKGTGHAVMCAEKHIPKTNAFVAILLGDVPLIKFETIKNAIEKLNQEKAAMLIITMEPESPDGYGRIIRDKNGYVEKISEDKDCSIEEKKVKEVNTGTFIYDAEYLVQSINKINCNNAQSEYYLTDTVSILVNQGKKVIAEKCKDMYEFTGVNSRDQLKFIEEKMGQAV
ncbi:MAG: sugar phosphate nucleotidyltransferase [Spirochaetia bacterium]|nr:sugar phosphate nucleotidyltransferase [Spirochaetia bacterium]